MLTFVVAVVLFCIHNSYEESRLFQLYSPEITFQEPNFSEGLKFKVVGSVENVLLNCGEWCKQYLTEDSYKYNVTATGTPANEVRASGVISLLEHIVFLESFQIQHKF